MKYPKEYLDEIKTRLKVSTIVSKTVNLKKRGKEFVGLSPFKNEKTPSFTVNDEKGFYHCFSTSEHGNIFDFLMKTQNLKFGESVKTLANLAGMRPYTFSKKDEEREKNWQHYVSIYSKYIEFYHDALLKNSNSELAKNYLKNRNVTIEEVKKFNIGYVEKNPNFYEKIKDKFDEKFLKECGLFYFDEKKKQYVERFRARVIFPINSISDQPIAIGGRTIQNDNYQAKYINSPETQFFKKGNNLYNINRARKLSNSIDQVFLVEGYMDVVGLSKNGVENAVANLGTALTERQILMLGQFFNEVIICFDGDESGYKAAVRAAENSIKELQPEKHISFLFLPEGEDPDSYVNKNGKDTFLSFSKQNKISIYQFIFSHYYKLSTGSPPSLAILEKKLRSIANSIKDEFIKKYILEFFLEKISSFTPNINIRKKFIPKKISSLRSTQRIFNETKSLNKIELKEYSLLFLIINNLQFFKERLDNLKELHLFSHENKEAMSKIINHLEENDDPHIVEIPIDNKILYKVNKYASIKHIFKNINNDKFKLMEIYDEITKDLSSIGIDLKIEELESQFSQDLNENTFNQIKELKKLQNIN